MAKTQLIRLAKYKYDIIIICYFNEKVCIHAGINTTDVSTHKRLLIQYPETRQGITLIMYLNIHVFIVFWGLLLNLNRY